MAEKNKPKFLIYHHNGGTDTDLTADTHHHTFQDVNAWHKHLWPHFESKLGFHIGYQWYIDWKGKITQGRDELEKGAHCIGMNTASIAVGLAGNFDRPKGLPNSEPTEAQKKSFKKLTKEICKRHNISKEHIVGHRYFCSYKTCPGKNIPDDWAQELLKEEKVEVLEEKFALLQKLLVLLMALLKLKTRFHNLLAGLFGKNNYV